VTMTLVAASTTPCALAQSFTPGILQRLPDAESGLPLVGLSGAGDHIVHALLFSTIEDWFHARTRIAVELPDYDDYPDRIRIG